MASIPAFGKTLFLTHRSGAECAAKMRSLPGPYGQSYPELTA